MLIFIYWDAIVDVISNRNGITTYSYNENIPYDYTIVDPGNMSGDNWKIVDSDLAFTEVHANKEDMGMTTITHFYYPQTTYNYDTN